MSERALTQKDLGRATLARQMLLAREDVSVVEAVERLAGMQAQEPRPPFGGLWSRVVGFERGDLIDALEAGRVVRATMMRATLHLVSAADYRAMRPALQPVMTSAMTGALRGRDEGLDLEQVVPVARELFAEEPRTFDEVRTLLQKRFPKVNDRALGYSVRLNLPLAVVPTDDRFGFPRGARFGLVKGWRRVRLDRAADVKPLVRRYLAAFGPATAADMQTWSGLGGLGEVFEGMRDELTVLRGPGGRELFDLPDAPRPGADAPAPPRLLPDFDNLVLAHRDRTRLLADEHRGEVTTKNLRVRATFLIDGRVRGTWRLERKGKKATLGLTPFDSVPKRWQKALREEAERMARALEEDAVSVDVKVE